MPKKEKTTLWMTCTSCGHQSKNHRVLYEQARANAKGGDDVIHRLVECMGCETIKYIISIGYCDCHDHDHRECDFKVHTYAPGSTQRRAAVISDANDQLVPNSVWKIYKETIAALNADIRTLAGGGLRATVEAICLDKQIKDKTLENKIEELAKQNLLTKAQAELLHEERYLGNAALHELATPSLQDIEDGLGIVEGLITTIYILPSRAKRLKESREAKKKTLDYKTKLTKI